MKSASVIIAACMSMSAFAAQTEKLPNVPMAELQKSTMYIAPAKNRTYNDYSEKLPDGTFRVKLLFVGKGEYAGQTDTKYFLVRCSTWELKFDTDPWESMKSDDPLGEIARLACIGATR